MIQLKHRDGTTIDLDGITDGQARAMTVALGKGWAFGTVQPVPTFTPIEVVETKPARKPRGPAWAPDPKVSAAILGWFAPGVEATIAKFCDETGMARDTATKHFKHLHETTMELVKVSAKTYRCSVPAKVDGTGAGVTP